MTITRKVIKDISLVLLSVFLVLSFTACGEGFWEEEVDPENQIIPEGEVDSISGLTMQVDKESGKLNISRKEFDKAEIPEDGVWTIFVYLCGTDLESRNGMGTDDMEEMKKAASSDKVRFVVQTGGTDGWLSDVEDDVIQRFVIQGGSITKVHETDNKSMGSPDTLSDFLIWGTKEYASEHMGLIMWNHGGGSITGVCFDELYDMDSITLMEMDSALLSCAETSGRKFDFIGYDACLMGTVEVANVLATYSDYMFGSEEMEPGSGWDYTAIGDFLANNPEADAGDLGRVVCDSFLEACKKQKDDSLTTLSVIDLSKMDNLLISFNDFAKSMYSVGENSAEIGEMIRGIEETDNFGGNNKTEGYTNMVDLGGICDACTTYVAGAEAVKTALSDAVVYKISGDTHPNASGLSIYYPLAIQGSNELSLFSKVSVSPYYLSFVDRQNNTGATDNSFESYDEEQWFEDGEQWDWGESSDDSYWNYLDDYEQTGESSFITFSEEPSVREDGSYGLTLDENGIDNSAGICAIVYELSEDGKNILEIGETTDVRGDWDSGSFSDNFDGYWLSLPDGQNLATYIVEETQDYVIYTSPILLNGEETNLRMKQYYSDEHVEIEGTWEGISEEGASAREIVKLKNGDVITPVYFAFSVDDDKEESEYSGQEFTVSGDMDIQYDMMPVGQYYYSFCIDDIYGDYYLSDNALFDIDEDGEITFITE
ncbi:MAG: Clostripain family protein [Eubacterium sp.]|nr:Clostripain family protein [Eubacterium sp.]